MDNDIKVSKYYDSEKIRKAIMLMEQFYALSRDKNLDEKNKICARRLFEHERRLAMCILMKEMEPEFKVDLIVNKEYMENMYKGYTV